MVFRPDWEKVVSPVVDFAFTLPDVDGRKIVLWGLSMGGLLAPRAAAFEHRLAALVAVDGVYDYGIPVRALLGNLPDLDRRLRADDDRELDAKIAAIMRISPVVKWFAENGGYVFGEATPRQTFAAWLDYNLLNGVAEKIACPALIRDGADDAGLAGQPKMLFDRLTGRKTFLEFTNAEGAGPTARSGHSGSPWLGCATGLTTPWVTLLS